MNRTTLLLLAGGLLAAGAGCDDYRAETVLHPDGGIDRAVYQNADATPEAAQKAGLWKQVTFAPRPEELDRNGWPTALNLFPVQAKDGGHPYFVAWNHFASVKDLPDTVRFKGPDGAGVPDGKLVRELTRTDLGLVEEFDWSETLTDVVNLRDMRKARDELADLVIRFLQDVFEEAEGKDYDTRDLVQWLKKNGKDWFDDLTDTFFIEAAAHKGRDHDSTLQGALFASCERHGLKLTKDGKPLPNDEVKKAINDFVVSLLGEKIKKDGKPVGRDQAQKWVDDLNSKEDGQFEKARTKVIEDKYGGVQAFDGRLQKLGVRILGLYDHIFNSQTFRCTMTFPGPVIETNGELVGAGDKVLWQFDASRAYPLGYPMTARSLYVPDAARKLLGRDAPLSDRDSLAGYADLVRGDEALTKVMRQCREGMSLDPLNTYIAAEKTADAAAAARAERVLKLLKAS